MNRSTLTKLSALVAGILIVACTQENVSSQSSSDAVAPLVYQTKITIGLDDTFPPMGFHNKAGELIGFDIDMAREAARRMNVEVSFTPSDWTSIEDELANKRIDAIWNGFSITEKRKKTILFTQPYMQNRQIVIVNSTSTIQTKSDLKDKLIGVQEGTTSAEAVQKEKGLAQSALGVKLFPSNVIAFMNLDAGKLDAVVVDEVFGRYYTLKAPTKYRILPEDLGVEYYAVGLRKEDTALAHKLDKVLTNMRSDGTITKIYAKWFGGGSK